MDCTLSPITPDDRDDIIAIFNHYVTTSLTAFPSQPVGPQFFDLIMNQTEGYPRVKIVNREGQCVGFGLLQPYNQLPTFASVAEATYFLHPDYTGRGIGTALLEELCGQACNMGLTSILARISSENPGSLAFHRKHGFQECGCFEAVGEKNGTTFDLVWMQKKLT